MKAITSGLKNWQTTIIGIALAVLLIMQDSKDLTNWQEWVFPALIAALGILSRDANKSSKASGIAPLLIVGLCSMFFVSCMGNSDFKFDGASLMFIDESGAKAGLTVSEGKTKGWGKVPITDEDGKTRWIKVELPPMDLIKNIQPINSNK